MDEEQKQRFVTEGRNRLTALNHAIRHLDDWADAFLLRGGAETFGADATLIAAVNAKVQAAIGEADLATLARLRTDV